MKNIDRTTLALFCIMVVFLGMTAAFRYDLWGHSEPLPTIPLVDKKFLSTDTTRMSFMDRVRYRQDVSDFDCNGCHAPGERAPLTFNRAGNVVVPSDHGHIRMSHGTHNRNNNCYNCHDETNRNLLQARDGHVITYYNSQRLCGSCHGPSLRDWEAGAHGRTSGYWNRDKGEGTRKVCASCHNPHNPKYEGREPAPLPHPLRPMDTLDHGIDNEGENRDGKT